MTTATQSLRSSCKHNNKNIFDRPVYHEARNLAVNNGRVYHLAAVLLRKGKVIKVGTNTYKTHPRFKRQYDDGTWGSHMHAEMSVLRFSEPGDVLEVMRFKKSDMSLGMAKPCRFCMYHIRKSGIKSVKYTTDAGTREEIIL